MPKSEKRIFSQGVKGLFPSGRVRQSPTDKVLSVEPLKMWPWVPSCTASDFCVWIGSLCKHCHPVTTLVNSLLKAGVVGLKLKTTEMSQRGQSTVLSCPLHKDTAAVEFGQVQTLKKSGKKKTHISQRLGTAVPTSWAQCHGKKKFSVSEI